MYIQEAVKEAMETGKTIYREIWVTNSFIFSIEPTNTPDCCLAHSSLVSCEQRQRPARGWQPTAADLMANDWYVGGVKR